MKRAKLEAHCPLCYGLMEDNDEICDECDAWGSKNNINLRERLREEE